MSTAVSLDTQGALAGAQGVGTVSPVRRRSRWWVEALALLWLLWVYEALTNFAPLRLHVAVAHAEGLLHAEQALHLDPEQALDTWLAGQHTLGVILSDYYDNAHFVVTFGLLGWLWWRRADIYRPLRNSLVLVNLLAFIVFWLYPVAPPRMLAGFIDIVESSHAVGSFHSGSLASHADELAAMPSLHIAWAVWCSLALWRMSARRWVRGLAILYPSITAFAVIATGNHFVFDIIGGLLAIGLSVAIVRLAERLRASRRPPGEALAAARVRRSLDASKGATQPAYRMSQTCYEVTERVD
ncbi:MAG TPA: phosphatase PAP2 family protein [Solirubrobacteraceae bacterium]|nr:phosphatase PAP2 family protein [Solirubrobacteraceae bacterium]